MQKQLNPYTYGLLAVVAGYVCLSTTPPVVKIGLLLGYAPAALLFFRLALGSLLLGGHFLIHHRSFLLIDQAGLRKSLLAALLNTASMLLYYLAITHIHISLATVLFSLYPFFTLMVLAMIGEWPRALDLLRFAVSLVGVYLLVGASGTPDLAGVSLAIGSSAVYAVHTVYVQKTLKKYSHQTISIFVIFWMAVAMGGVALAEGAPLPAIDVVGLSVIAWSALLSTAVARLLIFGGLQRIGSGQTALLAPLESILTALWAALLLEERLVAQQYAGMAMVLCSVLGGFLTARQPNMKNTNLLITENQATS